MKICSKHNEEKVSVGTQGQFKCRSCNKENQAKWWANNKELHLKRVKSNEASLLKRKQDFVYGFFLENPCVNCGEEDPIVLEFDHLRDKKFNVSRLINGSHYSLKTLIDEIDKCQILCANCHKRKTARDFGWWKVR